MSGHGSDPTLARLRDGVNRRALIATGLGALASPAVLRVIPANAQSKTIKMGSVSPRTGPQASFGETDGFIVDQVSAIVQPGLPSGGKTYPVEIISGDSGSSASHAADVANNLIANHQVDLIVASATPDTVNPVADQAEANEVPCITTNCPWEPYFFGRNGDPAKGFAWTYHFFSGLEDIVASYLPMWESAATNKVVGTLYPDDAGGNGRDDPQRGMSAALVNAGYRLHDPGRYQPTTDDFTPQISAFKSAGVEIVVGSMSASEFAKFWPQAGHQNFHPKICTIGKALLFPSLVNTLRARGDGLSTEIFWTPNFPFNSGLTGQSARQLTDAYTDATSRPWTQPIGYQHALFEVAIDVLKRTKAIDPKSIRDAIATTDYRSIVGQVQWSGQPIKNIAKTPLVAGQWQRKGDRFDLVIAENKSAPQIPVGGKLELLP